MSDSELEEAIADYCEGFRGESLAAFPTPLLSLMEAVSENEDLREDIEVFLRTYQYGRRALAGIHLTPGV